MKMVERHGVAILLSIISVALYLYIAYFLQRESFLQLTLSVTILFGAYFFLLRSSKELGQDFLFGVGMLFRLVFILSIPALSDDFYRFIWDGQLVNQGIDPYQVLPIGIEADLEQKEELLEGMNSPEYYSVYPPVLQYMFAAATRLNPSSLLSSIVSMRVLILLGELGNFFLIKKILSELKLSSNRVFIYFLNPLVVIELTANLHFEAVMIFFSLLGIYWAIKSKIFLSVFSICMAFLSKLIPLLLLPMIWRSQNWRGKWVLVSTFIAATLLLSFPLVDLASINGIAGSLDLYVQKFEFNASVYYVLRYLGFLWKGYNIIEILGPVLMSISAIFIFYLLFIRSSRDWRDGLKNLLFATSLYYFLSTTVHPWYICFIVMFGLYTNYLYPIVWSLLVFLSYAAYSHSTVQVNYWILVIQYTPVYFLLFYEIKNKGLLAKYFQDRVYLQHN